MSNEQEHRSGYALYAKTAIVLLALTAINISIVTIFHSRWSAGIVVLMACVQAFIALSWFMHLKFDNRLFRVLVGGVFLLYLMVIIITYFDYLFR